MRKWRVVKMERFFCPQTIKKGFRTKKEAEEFKEQYRKENMYKFVLDIEYEDSPECFGSELQYSADGCEDHCVFCSDCWKKILRKKYHPTDAERQ